MQMRRMYESTSPKRRAQRLRRDARELQRAGFEMFADINLELAEQLWPQPREDRRSSSKFRKSHRDVVGA